MESSKSLNDPQYQKEGETREPNKQKLTERKQTETGNKTENK